MAVYPYKGFASFVARRINKTVTPQHYARSAFLSFMIGVTGSAGGDLEIGRPNEGLYLTGASIDAAEKENVRGKYEFLEPIQDFKTSNTQVTGPMGTMPSVANATTGSQDVALQNAATFRWCVNIDTPLLIWNTTLHMAMNNADSDGGIAAGTIVARATQIAIEEHYDNVNSRTIYGAPSNQNAQTWNDIGGVISALTSNNVYGMIDRSGLPTGHPWLPQYSASLAGDITYLIDYANVTKGINVFGSGITLVLAGGTNYLAFKNQALARDRGGSIVSDWGKEGLPNMAKYGMLKEVVKVNGAYVTHEPFLDTCYGTTAGTTTALYTAQPGYVLILNLKNWRFITHPNFSMKPTGLVDLSDKSEAAKDASQAFIRTWAVCECLRPDLNMLVAAVT